MCEILSIWISRQNNTSAVSPGHSAALFRVFLYFIALTLKHSVHKYDRICQSQYFILKIYWKFSRLSDFRSSSDLLHKPLAEVRAATTLWS